MPRIIVLGGGVCGLAAAMLLARDGHDVTVLERDAAPVPTTLDEALDGVGARAASRSSARRTTCCPRGRAVLDEELPDVRDALRRRGRLPASTCSASCRRRSPTARRARATSASPRSPRAAPSLEWVLARAAQAGARRRGPPRRRRRGARRARVDGTPHVTGVRTDRGDELRGRPRRRRDGPPLAAARAARGRRRPPVARGGRGLRLHLLHALLPLAPTAQRPGVPRRRRSRRSPSFSVLTLPADNEHVVGHALHRRRRPRRSRRCATRSLGHALVRACPRHAHWVDAEPITDVLAMGGVVDRYRRMVVDGDGRSRPAWSLLADAWACTNPSLGRGMTLGLMHAAPAARLRPLPPGAPRRARRGVGHGHRGRADAVVPRDRRRGPRPAAPRSRPTAPAPPPPPLPGGDAGCSPACRAPPSPTRTCSGRSSPSARASTLPEEVLARPGLAERVLELVRATPGRRRRGPTARSSSRC